MARYVSPITQLIEGLNAQFLGGYQAADFLRKAESATLSGSIVISGTLQVGGAFTVSGNATLGADPNADHSVRGVLRLVDSGASQPLYFGDIAAYRESSTALRIASGLNLSGALSASGLSVFGNTTLVNNLNVGGNVEISGTLSAAGNLSAGGFDFRLGYADQSSRGNSGLSRALVKDSEAKLVINYAGDFPGGTEVQGAGLTVKGRLNVEGLASATGRNLAGLQGTAYQRPIWSPTPGQWSINQTVNTTDYLKGGGSWQFTNETWAMLDQLIPVDPSRTYAGRVRVKKVDGTGTFYAGYVAYDKNLNMLAGNGGTFGYFIASGVTPPTGQWTTYEGTITGTGTDINQFPAGTAYIKPLIIANYNGSGNTLVGDFELWEVSAESGTLDLSNALLSWNKDTDCAKIYMGDYGIDQKWLTLEFGDNDNDRVRFRYTSSSGAQVDVLDVAGTRVDIRKPLHVQVAGDSIIRLGDGEGLITIGIVGGRFLIAPYDDGAWQWEREFGYDPGTNRWYVETCLDLSNTGTTTSDYGWNRVIGISNGSHGAIENTAGHNAIGLHSDSNIYFVDTRAGATKYAAILDVRNARLGVGVNIWPEYTLDVRTSTQNIAASIRKTNDGSDGGTLNGPTLYVSNAYGNHSWGQLAEFVVESGSNCPWIGFKAAYTGHGWGVGYAGPNSPDFAIVQNRGYRYGSWGTNRLTISTTGTLNLYPDNPNYAISIYNGMTGGADSGSLVLLNGLKMVWGVTEWHHPDTSESTSFSFSVAGLSQVHTVMLTTEVAGVGYAMDVVYQLRSIGGNSVYYVRQCMSGAHAVWTRCRWLAIGAA